MPENRPIASSPIKIVILYILITLFILVAGIRYYYRQQAEIKADIHSDLSTIAELKMNQIVYWRKERMGDAFVFFNNSTFARDVQNWFKNQDKKSYENHIVPLVKSYRDYYHYKNIILFDNSFHIRYSANGSIDDIGITVKDYFKNSVNNRKPEFTNIYYCDLCKDNHLDILFPLMIGDDVIGGMILRIDPADFLFPLIQSWPTNSSSAESILISIEGKYVFYLNELRHQKGTSLKFKIDSVNSKLPAVMAAMGKEGMFEGVDYRGIPVLTDIRKIPDSPWYIIAKVDIEEIYAPVRDRAVNISMLTGLVLVAIGIGFIWVWTNQKKSLKIQHLNNLNRQQALIKHFEYVVKYANDIFLLADKNFNIVEINQRALQVYGYSREEFVGLNVKDLRAPETLTDLEKQFEVLRSSPEALYETIHKRKDGSTFPVEASVRQVEINGEKFLQGIIKDISERKKAEENIKESEDRFKYIFESANVGKSITQLSGEISVNKAFCDMLGYSKEELENKKWQELTPLDEIDGIQKILESLRKGEKDSVRLNKNYIHKNGKLIWTDVSAVVRKDKNGKPLYFIATINDLSELKDTIQKLRESEIKFRSLFENSILGIYRTTPEGQIINCNPALLTMLGYERLEDLSKRNLELDGFEAGYSRAEFRKKIETEGEIIGHESAWQKKDGTYIYVNENAKVVKDEDGEFLFYEGTVEDITKRKKAEEGLRLKNLVFDASIAANSIADINGIITEANDAFLHLWGYSEKDEVIGKPITSFLQNSGEAIIIVEAIKNTDIWEGSYIARRKDHTTFIAYGFATILKDATGKRIGYQSAVLDITEQKKAEEELNRNKELLNEMGKIARIGGWEFDPITLKGTWTEQVAHIHDMVPNDETNVEKGTNFYIGESKIKIENAIKEAIEKGTSYDLELEMITAKGNHKWVRTIGLADKSGDKVNRIHGSFQDITEFKKAEAALQESEERLRLSLKAARQGLYDLNIQTGEAIVNDEYAMMLGYDSKTFKESNQLWIERLHPEDKDLSTKAYQDYINGISKEFSVEFRQKTKNGEWKWILSTGSIVEYDKNKNPLRMLGTHTDITERKKAEELLKESEDKFRTLFESMNEGVALHELVFDEKGIAIDYRIIDVNPAFEQHTGINSEKAKNQIASEFYGTKPTPPYFDVYSKVALTGISCSFESYFSKLNMHFDVSVFSPKKNFFATVFTDITERKKTELEIQENERKLREAQEMAHLGYWNWDIKTGNVEWSDEVYKIFRLDPEKFIPHIDSILAFSPWPEYNNRGKEIYEDILKGYNSGSYEQKFLRPDNSIAYYYSSYQGKFDENRELVSIVGTVMDITERKKIENEINQLNEELEQKVKERTRELEEKNTELERMNKLFVGRELRMIELKQKIKELEEKLK